MKLPGRMISQPRGYKAFLPDPLPPELTWTPALLNSLSDADRLLGQLAGEGAKLANPRLLIRPFVRREAVYSSRIEGTHATLGEILISEAGGAVNRSPDDMREVGNYVGALEYGLRRLKQLPLSLRLVRELHEQLMKGLPGESHATPGQFRKTQNWIGPPGSTLMTARHIPPPPDELMNCLGPWEKFLHNETIPPLVNAAMAHYQFETIHPFLDGNGRVGRLLITLFLMERRILPAPLLYLSAFFEATRKDYYDALNQVRTHGDWEGWLHYFFNAVARQSEDALGRAQNINKTLDGWKKKASSSALQEAINLLAKNPYLTVNSLAEYFEVAFSTAQRTIDQMQRLKILEQVDEKKRGRVYCAKAILKILEAPAQIIPKKDKTRG